MHQSGIRITLCQDIFSRNFRFVSGAAIRQLYPGHRGSLATRTCVVTLPCRIFRGLKTGSSSCRLVIAVILPWLASALLVVGCSSDDAPSDVKTADPPAAESVGPELVQAGIQAQGSGFDPVRVYDARCSAGEEEPSLECEWLRGLAVADVVEALETILDSRDQRGVEEALAALDLDDEPEVLSGNTPGRRIRNCSGASRTCRRKFIARCNSWVMRTR
jgi:hypothetical protein